MAAPQVLSLVLTTVFGVISTVGVVYQVADIRRRHVAVPPGVPDPRTVARIRLLLLILTILAIPNAGLWVSAAVAQGSPAIDDPDTWFTAILGFLVLSVPLAVLPTVLSVYIGRGRAWARFTAIVVLSLQGLCCGVFGFTFPIGVATGIQTGTSSPALNVSLGLSLFLIGLVSIIVVIMLLRPRVRAYFH